MAGHDLSRLDLLAAEETGDHRLSYHAGADGGDGGIAEW